MPVTQLSLIATPGRPRSFTAKTAATTGSLLLRLMTEPDMGMEQIKAGSTDVSVRVRIVDSTDGTPETGVTSTTPGLSLYYQRDGAATTAISLSNLTALTDAHIDGGIYPIGNGYYRLDLPDAAVAASAASVLIAGGATGMIVIGKEIDLVAVDMDDAVRMGMTALPNAAADAAGGLPISDAGGLDLDAIKTKTDQLNFTGTDVKATLDSETVDVGKWNGTAVPAEDTAGYPKVTIKAGTGTGEVNVSSGKVPATLAAADVTGDLPADVTKVSGDSTAADNLELDYDGTGYAKTNSTIGTATTVTNIPGDIHSDTAQAGAAGTITLDSGASATDDFYNGASIATTGGTGAGQVRTIYDYVGSTKVASITPDWTTTPDATTTFSVLPTTHSLIGDIADLDDTTGSVAAYLASKLGLITSSTALTTNNVNDGDDLIIFQGETRNATNNNAIEFAIDGTETNYTGYTPKLTFTDLVGSNHLDITGSVVGGGTSAQVIRYELTSAETTALTLSVVTGENLPFVEPRYNFAYGWEASVTDGVDKCPVIGRGRAIVKRKGTSC